MEGIDDVFVYHSPKNDQAKRYAILLAKGREFGLKIAALCPDSRERDKAFVKIEEAIMWANSSIARNE